jgi:6-phosphogluconolactonase
VKTRVRMGAAEMRGPTTVAVMLCLPMAASASLEPRAAPPIGPPGLHVYVGTYTSADSKGIYHLTLDLATGALAAAGEPTTAVNPSFLAFHPSGRYLYAVNETGESRRGESGAVSAYSIDAKTGALTFLNRQASGGAAPCHLSLDIPGRHLFVANYGGGSVAVLPIEPGGRLGPATSVVRHEGRGSNPRRQEAPHAHAVHLDPTNALALVADLGLDRLVAYRFDPRQGALIAHEPATVRMSPGAGPRHFVFHSDGRLLYVLNELGSTVTALRYDAPHASFAEFQSVSTLPEGFAGENAPAEIAVRADGKFLYASNRGHDSIAIFAIEASTGRLAPQGHRLTQGKGPRHFAIDPTGAYLLAANQDSDSIVVFRIDAASGRLEPVGPPFRVPKPVCVRIQAPS